MVKDVKFVCTADYLLFADTYTLYAVDDCCLGTIYRFFTRFKNNCINNIVIDLMFIYLPTPWKYNLRDLEINRIVTY